MGRSRKIVRGRAAVPPFLGNIATNLGKHTVQQAAKAFERNVNADTITNVVSNVVKKIAKKIQGKGLYKGRRTQRAKGVYKGRRTQKSGRRTRGGKAIFPWNHFEEQARKRGFSVYKKKR